MGVVIRQSFWITVIGYMGIIAGYVSTLILRPMYMTEEEIGLVNLVISNGLMLAPVVSLGMPGTYLRLVHQVDESLDSKRNLFTFQFFIIVISNAILIASVWLFLPLIQSIFEQKSDSYNQYLFISLLILLFYSLFNQLTAYSRALLDTIFAEFLRNVFLRIANIILILLFSFQLIDFDILVKSISGIYALALLLNLTHLIWVHDFKFVFRLKEMSHSLRKELITFGGYLLLISFGGAIANQIFFLLVSVYIGLDANGIFTTCFYIATVIEMPKRSMQQVLVPIFTREFKANNLLEINNLYRKSSLTLGVMATLILLGVVCNLDDLFLLIPKGEVFREGTMVVMIISAAKVVDLIFGFNSEIINYSKYYKSLLIFTSLYALVTLVTCFLLIPSFGINGAAWSFFISMLVYNAMKFFFLKTRYNLTPFTKNHLVLIVVSLFIYFMATNIHFELGPLYNIITKSILITLSYGVSIYFLKISTDINQLLDQILKRLFKHIS